jgi:hypothetical protein
VNFLDADGLSGKDGAEVDLFVFARWKIMSNGLLYVGVTSPPCDPLNSSLSVAVMDAPKDGMGDPQECSGIPIPFFLRLGRLPPA